MVAKIVRLAVFVVFILAFLQTMVLANEKVPTIDTFEEDVWALNEATQKISNGGKGGAEALMDIEKELHELLKKALQLADEGSGGIDDEVLENARKISGDYLQKEEL